LRVLQKQGVEITRATAPFTVTVPTKRPNARPTPTETASGGARDGVGGPRESDGSATAPVPAQAERTQSADRPQNRTFPAGSYIVRMDQPYSRIADSLLDYQYWSPNDPQRTPYDDTGWTFPELFNTQAVRVTDVKVLDAPMEKTSDVRAKGAVAESGSIFIVNHNADVALATLRYRLKDASFEAAEEPFDAAGKKFNRGSFIIRNVSAADMEKAASDLGLQIIAAAAAPSVKTHPLRAPRVAILHTWISTQTEGWWRQEFDLAHVPYSYISTQQVAKDGDLRAQFDVIVFPPV